MPVRVAFGVNRDGYHEILGVTEASREATENLKNFFRDLEQRGRQRIWLIVSGKSTDVLEAIDDFF